MTLQRIRKRLEYLADKIEATLAAQHCPGRIVGGTFGPRGVRLTLQPMPSITFEQVQSALSIEVQRSREGIVLQIPLTETFPVLTGGAL